VPVDERTEISARRVRFEDYEVDFARFELRKSGVRIALQRKPFRILELLLRRPGELVTREELFRFLWPDSHVSFEHGLNTAVNSLRNVLGESSRDCRFIETRPGIGYRFSAPVERVSEPDSMPAQSLTRDKNLGAYQDCLKGRYFLDAMCEEDVHKALAFFNSAVADDTFRSLAHAGIADAYCQLALLGSAPLAKLVCHARSAAEVALRNDPDLVDAHISTARVKMVFDWDWKGAEEAANRALALDSSSVSALNFHASLLFTSGRYEEAREVCRKLLSLDPLSFPGNLQLAANLHAAGDYTGATDQCWNILTLAPTFAPAQILLALAYEQLGMYEESLIEFQNAQSWQGLEAAAAAGMGHVFAVTGRDCEAEQCSLKLSRQGESRYISPYWHAVICAGQKQEDRAISNLEESLRQRDPALLWLKADARFHALLNESCAGIGFRNRLDGLLPGPPRS
jgi:DNA-binding winged helix-turn-helix (wHTH) protein/Tfp pilus assembly protein PilF